MGFINKVRAIGNKVVGGLEKGLAIGKKVIAGVEGGLSLGKKIVSIFTEDEKGKADFDTPGSVDIPQQTAIGRAKQSTLALKEGLKMAKSIQKPKSLSEGLDAVMKVKSNVERVRNIQQAPSKKQFEKLAREQQRIQRELILKSASASGSSKFDDLRKLRKSRKK